MHPGPVDQLVGQLHVVLQVVLVFGFTVPADGAGDVAGVTERALGDGAVDGPHRIDAKPHVVEVIQRVKHPEDVDARRVRLLSELPDDVVGVGSVPDGVGAAEEHLQRDVGHGGAELLQPLPGALVQKPQGNVEGGPAPNFQRSRGGQRVGRKGRGADEVVRAHASRQQRLVRIAHRRVCHQ